MVLCVCTTFSCHTAHLSDPLGSGGCLCFCEGFTPSVHPPDCRNASIGFHFIRSQNGVAPTVIMLNVSFPDWPAMERKASDFFFSNSIAKI